METGTLKELNAQPGDVVECVTSRSKDWWTVGKHYTAISEYGARDDEGSGNWNENEATFRIVSRAKPTGPVRTVTRKEIVPGLYPGDVRVTKSREIFMQASRRDADTIRAAIATLTEIAEALEGGCDV